MDGDWASVILLTIWGVAVFAILFKDAFSALRAHRRMDDYEPGTSEDPRCAYTLARQHRVAAQMHRTGKLLLDGRAYKPTLTKATEAAPKASKVVPIRRKP